MDNNIRIGCASAFWGDTDIAAPQLVHHGEIDYLVFDYLAEVTMSILSRSKLKDDSLGYVPDFINHIGPLLSVIKEKNIKIISNAGGINLDACRNALLKVMKNQNIDFKIAIIEGDNIINDEDELRSLPVNDIESNDSLPNNVTSMNVYLGAAGIKKALELGADIVITGRCVDSAVVLGPLMYEFGWKDSDYDLLASGSLAGHIVECGAQCTGGNFTDWELVNNFENIGFPIIEVSPNGNFLVTKPKDTGGIINRGTVSEQFLYEIEDPGLYYLPDVVCDFTNVIIKQKGKDLVHVSGAKGLKPTNTYKVSSTYADGYKIAATLVIGGPKSVKKANLIGESILRRTRLIFHKKDLGDYTKTKIYIIGAEEIYGQENYINNREVVLRIMATHNERPALVVLSREIAQAVTGMAPGVMNYLGGRPSISPYIRLFSFLINKNHIKSFVNIDKKKTPIYINTDTVKMKYDRSKYAVLERGKTDSSYKETKLINLAFARSGDKGDHSNIGVIAREPEFLPYIRKGLSLKRLEKCFAHVLEGSIECWEVPGVDGLNFVLRNSLGGGGIASLNIDPQGKAYAQQILDLKILVPENIYNKINHK